mmetsp:Transcript_17900/g.45117  ORF Transcript_17900/g.45117 Transcript_17900/m.45117 type:complete len:212 (-) Transcript_17900:483-1118(-)|eukprot:CAMPEP_0202864102 /NCGR_PEP_ID=MMETSP1391-20130828/4469_1 /ASSEMBLY_ACC=CAM_ASM_000867 /TAXON_ID=1034604 /ORGANISM="Chlamydomonas leiostraca, Strain SAG 11-49" /LENGTH=211 /DNA_ID=CAMNT_0049543813 /DNA_START=80 /DNA_END=715 /DNA_ORIENTATION=+
MASTMQTSRTQVAATTKRSQMAAVRPSVAATRSVAVSSKAATRTAFAAPAPVAARSTVTRAAAAPAAASSAGKTETKRWYALVASADFFFNDPQNESMAEQLRERVRFFTETGRDRDFYIVPEPKWLDAKYPEQAKLVKRPCVALIGTDKHWITFMKLRLDRVVKIDLPESMSDSEVLAVGGQVPEFPAPAKWTAPYARYTPGWWEVFFPK